jgi:hypothetical protein
MAHSSVKLSTANADSDALLISLAILTIGVDFKPVNWRAAVLLD